MDERLKQLRKALDMTQEEFAKRVGIKRNTLANYEIGRNDPIDGIVHSICREFNVNEDWLRTGNGDIFVEVPTDVLDVLAERYNLNDMAKRIVKTFVELEDGEMNAVLKFIGKLVQESDEFAATFEMHEQKPRYNEFEDEIERARSILDAQAAMDEKYNKGGKVARSS